MKTRKLKTALRQIRRLMEMDRKDIFRLLGQELYGDTNCCDAVKGCEGCVYIELCIQLDHISEEVGVIENDCVA
jgi:hypothetical protein